MPSISPSTLEYVVWHDLEASKEGAQLKIVNFLRAGAVLVCTGAILALSGCATNPSTTTTLITHATVVAEETTPTTTGATSSKSATDSSSKIQGGSKTAPKKNTPPTPPLIKLGANTPMASYLNEALSVLGYMPVRFTPAHQMTLPAAMQALGKVQAPLPGSYAWKDKGTASQLSFLWKPHTDNVMTEGALMRFQADHNLAADGVAGPQTWKALSQALKAQQVSTAPYLFITVTEHPTEVLKLWKNGTVVLQTAANTGIASSPTTLGTWPIYLRYPSQEMKGTTPWGTTYDDPGVPYVNYFYQGEAVHGFSRPSYGSPQSMGCVEIPIATAETVYNTVTLGTLVSVRSS